jgi:hypothetical protein
MTEDLDDLMCPHSAAGRPERFPAKACILAGECGCVYGAEWSRALRLADGDGGMTLANDRDERLAEALEEIRSRSTMNLAMRPDPFALTAELGNIHQIADAAIDQARGKGEP